MYIIRGSHQIFVLKFEQSYTAVTVNVHISPECISIKKKVFRYSLQKIVLQL
jgi:hypothetical protein